MLRQQDKWVPLQPRHKQKAFTSIRDLGPTCILMRQENLEICSLSWNPCRQGNTMVASLYNERREDILMRATVCLFVLFCFLVLTANVTKYQMKSPGLCIPYEGYSFSAPPDWLQVVSPNESLNYSCTVWQAGLSSFPVQSDRLMGI